MKKKIAVIMAAGAMVTALSLAGCARGPTRVEMEYGVSYRTALMSQTLDPHAEKNLEPVYGLQGPAAELAAQRYRRSFAIGQTGASSSALTAGAGSGQLSGSSGLGTGSAQLIK